MESLPTLTDDDRATLLGLVLLYGVLSRENVVDRRQMEQLEARIKGRRERMGKLFSGFQAFGITDDGEGYFKKIRAAVGDDAYVATLGKIDAIIPDPNAEKPPEVGPVAPRPESEREPEPPSGLSIREMVIESLQKSFPMGRFASDIREAIESRRKAKLHDKTIGMTLYRLSQADPPLARREGTTWFFVPPDEEKKNPGGETPGPSNGSN